ncbi:50S ribosomal protein L25/general stress protein Ctc [Homoserinimonas hongtaonis]|uniref:Large ribosomal subunit protein bL25 n=1 Tax=Homoserinimonas hongtaonis TaxID=2079791 RepID=A0A2U1T045_9MICO|nr:50S ribosomal protein L25/general stress protein Ctc [Salinibacterium hongtaonis]AWB89800.1 50S ribosomal protein L25 [Salinibacterium hongtaonis]PWB97254.1 50S ribosomal protein L25/general stress protein Ctc [Salinibacterium hongtaonis]
MGEKTSRAGRPSVASTTEPSNNIVAEQRENFGKGFARRLRAEGKIPAVLYGHGTEPQHLALPGHETALLLRKANAMLELDINGKSQTALVKDVQKDPVRQIIEHIDLVVIRKGEKVQVDVPVHVVGEAAPGASVEQDAHSLLVEAPATSIPEALTISVEGVEPVTHILASEIELPKGVTLIADPETLIVSVVAPSAAEETEAAAEAPAEAAE